MDDYPRFDLGGPRRARDRARRAGSGRAISLALAHAGADVALGLHDVGRRRARPPRSRRWAGGRSRSRWTCSTSDQIGAAVDEVVARFGRLDILVNNAGVSPEDPAENVTEANFDLTIGVNVKGVFFASQAAGRVMIRAGVRADRQPQLAGRVRRPADRVRLLHVEGGRRPPDEMPRGRVGSATGSPSTPSPRRSSGRPGTAGALADPAFEAETIERIAGLHRIGEPMEVAGAVVFLASPAASLITGHTLLIDGGWTAR